MKKGFDFTKITAAVSLFLALVMLAGLISCTGNTTPETTTAPAESTAPAETTAAQTQPADSTAPSETTAEQTKPADSTAPAETPAAQTKPADSTAPAETTAEQTQPADSTAPAETTAAQTKPETTPPETTEAPVEDTKTLDGKRVIFIGNSMIYYGGVVTKGGYRSTDTGYFYNICKENGMKTTVIDCTYGSHHLYDFAATGCKTSGCDVGVGGDLLAGVDLSKIDVVFMSEAGDNNASIVTDVKNIMKRFTNPDTVFVYMAHTYTYTKNHTNIINNLKKLQDLGILIVDWGHLCFDVYSGNVKVPGATLNYVKNTFVNNCSGDSHHPNPLAGYIAAQMCFCAVTGKSAVGQSYEMKTKINFGAGSVTYAAYNTNYYTSGASNFKSVFDSAADMAGIQQLMDVYLKKWGLGEGSNTPAETTAACEHSMKENKVLLAATQYLPGSAEYKCEKCGATELRELPRTETRTNLALNKTAVCYSASKSSVGKPAFVTDGDIANNSSGNILSASYVSGGAADAFGGKKPANENKVALKKAGEDGSYEYYYVVVVDLGGQYELSGMTMYLHGYKKTVMDTGFEILASADGENWERFTVYNGKESLFSGANDGIGYENYVDSDTATATDALPAYFTTDSFSQSSTKYRYVAYGCTGYREINGYYTARITEIEVYGK